MRDRTETRDPESEIGMYEQLLDDITQEKHVKWSPRGVRQPFLARLRRRVVLYFKKDFLGRIASVQKEAEALIQSIIPRLRDLSTYLRDDEHKAIYRKISLEIDAIERFSAIWDEYLAPSAMRLRVLRDTLKDYNERFIAVNARRYRAFFSGKETSTAVSLNDLQIRAILTDEKNVLTIAGPGSGKTRTLVDRVAFYVLKTGVSPEDILVLAYNNGAAKEVETRLASSYGISQLKVSTFHALGLSIITRLGNVTEPEGFIRRMQVDIESETRRVVREIIDELMDIDPGFRIAYMGFILRFLGSIDFKADTTTLEAMVLRAEQDPYATLDGKLVKSIAERDIGNFFFMNGIRYDYERVAGWCDTSAEEPGRTYRPDFYLPDYDIYLEHWAMSDGGHVSIWSRADNDEYERNRQWKMAQFQKHGKTLWETNFEQWRTGRLEEELTRLCTGAGISFRPMTRENAIAVLNKFPDENSVFKDAIEDAITTVKVTGFTDDGFTRHVSECGSQLSQRERAFYRCMMPVFAAYESRLEASSKIDFADMINTAGRILERLSNEGDGRLREAMMAAGLPAYKMVFVDEFQDISRQRLLLLQLVCKADPDCRLFCVGDDWQSIYGFSGASNKYFVDFGRYFSPMVPIYLDANYRNPQELIQYGTMVIDTCEGEFLRKKLLARGPTMDEEATVKIVRLPAGTSRQFTSAQAAAALRVIKELIEGGVEASEIMVVSRFNFGLSHLQQACDEADIPVEIARQGELRKAGIRLYSIHKSKGLEADHVLLLNMTEGTFGFPPRISGMFRMKFINPDLPDEGDEELRLLFVALTRAKKSVHLFTWEGHESRFLGILPSAEEELIHQLGSREIEGRIVHESEKAYRVEVSGKLGDSASIWLPKSQVLEIRKKKNAGGESIITITDWLAKAKIDDMSRSGHRS
nr:UvrD-helicase domain-containing protein [Candidatus Sigynarchaeum springense]